MDVISIECGHGRPRIELSQLDSCEQIESDQGFSASEVLYPERGVQTVEDLANMLLGHDMYHVEQLSAYL